MEHYLVRVTEQHYNIYKVMDEAGETMEAKTAGRLTYKLKKNTDFPAVGDWVYVDRQNDQKGSAVIVEIRPRKSILQRKEAGPSGRSQILAVNLDTVFLCLSMNQDFNLRRLERYLALVRGSSVEPVIVLTKSDLAEKTEEYLQMVREICPDIETLVCSAQTGEGMEQILSRAVCGKTIAFLGSSGVGKSTLINYLAGEEILAAGSVRSSDGKGRHTTTHRQLIQMENGCALIDTPGMRELGLDKSDVEESFQDIRELAGLCRFSNCTHTAEPGCAVLAAMEEGRLDQKRYNNFRKLLREEKRREKDIRRR